MTNQTSALPQDRGQSLSAHIRATLVLGVPLVVVQVTQMLINVTDTLMVGWLGVNELAAATLAFQMLFIVLIFGLGISAALMPLVANAIGKGDEVAIRRSTRMGLWALLATVMVLMVPLLFSEQILLFLGQDPELAALAQSYIIIAQWSLIPAFLMTGLRNFLAALEHTKAILSITIGVAILNAVLNYALIFGNFGAPRLELQGAAIATVIANVVAFVMLALYVHRSALTRHYRLFHRFWRADWQALRRIFALGLPIGLMIFAEAGLFSATSIMIGWLGAVPLAAHGVALQLASVAFMVPLGLSQAASVRVGNAVGRKDTIAIGRAGRSALMLGLGFAVCSALVFLIFPDFLVRLFLDFEKPNAENVLAYAVPLLFMAALFQVFDTVQVAQSGNLRGLQDTQMPMVIAIISYWPVGLTLGYVLGFPLGFGGVGIWGGLVAGLAVAALLLTWRFEWRERFGLIEAASR